MSQDREKTYKELYKKQDALFVGCYKARNDCKDENEYKRQGSAEWCRANGIDFKIVNAPTLSEYESKYGVFDTLGTAKTAKVRKTLTTAIVTERPKSAINGKQYKAIKDRAKRNFKNYLTYKEEGKAETAKGTFANVQKDLRMLESFGFAHSFSSDGRSLDIDKYREPSLL